MLLPVLLGALGSACWAQTTPVSVEWELLDQSPTLHEPILVRLTIENHAGAAPVTFDLGENQKDRLAFTIVEPDGSRHEGSKPDPFGDCKAGCISTPGEVEIAPGGRFMRDFIVNEWYRFDVPGEYGIEVRLPPPIAVGGQPVSIDMGASFRCDIAARDENSLRNRSGSLVDEVFASGSTADAMQTALKLSYVRDPVVVPYLKEVLSSPFAGAREVAIKALGRFTTAEAVDAVITLVHAPGPDRTVAIGTLGMMATRIDDAQLREHIHDVLEAARHR